MLSLPLRVATALSLSIWTLMGVVLVDKPITFYGMALSHYYRDWWIEGAMVTQTNPLFTAIAVMLGSVFLALSCVTMLLAYKKKDIEATFWLLFVVNAWLAIGTGAMLFLRMYMFAPMRPLVLFMFVPSCFSAAWLLIERLFVLKRR